MSKIKFKSLNNEFCVEINDLIISNIQNICIDARTNETGGILIGNYLDKNNAIIIEITGPSKDSKQSACKFNSGINGLIKLLNNKWNLGQYYIGEWHSHPDSSPQPSKIDDMQMKKLSIDKALKCPEPILLIIGGNRDKGWELSVHVYTKDSKVPLVKEN
ncbi:hypothetical protein BRM9_1538 [Methanobacterium formicicum]|uniref:JAB domain-containing protein n=1 Tax=Methanobacterium formicicum TaxID=2162 RepID=A0A089ZE93_METFO|nr:Mov34/MPN/PAD-1 family protein [Methanobacterium formicicum]AIS32352.1 hypothetical protein BRM9_1538 [Methanobacterium formicicum]